MIREPLAWLRWHGVELATVTAPTVAAVTVHPGWAALTLAAAGRWVWHEARERHEDTPPPIPDGARQCDDEREDKSA